jgi:hypothetical protein
MSDNSEPTVPVIPRSALRASKKKSRRSSTKMAGPRLKRVTRKIVRDGDAVKNNGRIYENRRGQIGMVVSANDARSIATVASEEGIVEWDYREIIRLAEG